MAERDTWFNHRTYHYRQFEPIAKLRAAKERAGMIVSVCLPARNEAPTIGRIVRTLRKSLVERSGLADEVIVVDGASGDDTARIAAAEGAAVYQEKDILVEEGDRLGKGEGLWKSLHVCKGDVICWVDSDIENIHSRFVYGLLGPLLADPSIVYTKAFYDRPIREGRTLRPNGGGRVTELVARPLLNLFWPHLAGMVQPLSGEYAGRREVLERIPFISGYGVELGLLIDIAAGWGVDAIAQVDLERRVHRNQDISALSRMSFGIMQAALRRLVDEGRLQPDSYATTFREFARGLDGYQLDPREDLVITERPPIVTVPGYRDSRAAELAGQH